MTAPRPDPALVQYVLEKELSRFTVRAFAGGMLSAMGHNPIIAVRDLTGVATFNAAAPAQSSLRLRIRADSLEVTNEMSGKDRREIETTMNQKVLESSRYPTIDFESSMLSVEPVAEGRFKVLLNGKLELHGVTREVPVTAQVAINGDMLRAYGEFAILQSAFNIPLVSVAGGALKLKDELKFTFDIVARGQE